MLISGDIDLELPSDWADAINAIAGHRRRVLLAGPTDVGKSSFARALMSRWPTGGALPALLDADPGQKMVGAPGAVTLSTAGSLSLQALQFVGTTSAAAVREIVEAVGALVRQSDGHPLIINSSGLIRGPGVALLTGMIRSAEVEEVVAIGWPSELDPMLDRTDVIVRRLRRPPGARRKGQGERARNRREAFRAHLAEASLQRWPRSAVRAPWPTVCLTMPAMRPICAVTDAEGRDLSVGVLVEIDQEYLQVFAPPVRMACSLRLGAMWAQPCSTGWELVDQLFPASG